jgi:hypothetical protein
MTYSERAARFDRALVEAASASDADEKLAAMLTDPALDHREQILAAATLGEARGPAGSAALGAGHDQAGRDPAQKDQRPGVPRYGKSSIRSNTWPAMPSEARTWRPGWSLWCAGDGATSLTPAASSSGIPPSSPMDAERKTSTSPRRILRPHGGWPDRPSTDLGIGSCRTCCYTTKVPQPCRVTTKPSSTRTRTALTTVARLTPCSAASSVTLGI